MKTALGLILLTASAAAAEPLRPGLYDVEVQVVIPHVDSGDYDFTRRICLGTGQAGQGETVLGPLGSNTLLNCPRRLRPSGEDWEASVICEGPNAGRALGRYRITADGFKGTVSLNMGGKNMTFSERHTGRWLGPC